MSSEIWRRVIYERGNEVSGTVVSSEMLLRIWKEILDGVTPYKNLLFTLSACVPHIS